jgi:hypothetical protein
MSPISKRDNSGFDIPPLAIVFLAMIGSGVLVVMGYAASRMFMSADDSESIKPLTVHQHEYMATVRARNLDMLESEAHRSLYGTKAKAAME